MSISLLHPLAQVPIAVIDVETTGASAHFGHRVIELGIVRLEGGRRVAEYQQLYDPNRRIGPGITALTGISQMMVDGQPRFVDHLDRVVELLGGAAVMGHNVRFDLSFVSGEFRRCGKDLSAVLGAAFPGPSVPVLDTVRIARRRFGRGGNALGRLARRLGIEPVTAHRALADAQTTHLVFEKLIEAQAGWETSLCDAIAAQGGPMGLLAASPRENVLPLELEEALEQRRPVVMVYLDARQKQTERVIEPLEIRRYNGDLTLIAHCHLRDDRRTFKLERIVELKRIDGPLPTVPQPCPEPQPAQNQPLAPGDFGAKVDGSAEPAVTAYIALGSNLGDRAANLHAALVALAASPDVEVVRVSTFVDNPAVGGPTGSPPFLNGAVSVRTTRSPLDLLQLLLDLETRLGRQRRLKWEPRTIDLDLLLYGDQVLSEPALTVPHPLMHQRRFVLEPLAELAPGARHPTLDRTIAELLAAVSPEVSR